MPAEGVALNHQQDVLSFNEITKVVKIGAEKYGINKIRLTGGEPLVRKDIVTLVKMIRTVKQIKEISLTTNGVFFQNTQIN